MRVFWVTFISEVVSKHCYFWLNKGIPHQKCQNANSPTKSVSYKWSSFLRGRGKSHWKGNWLPGRTNLLTFRTVFFLRVIFIFRSSFFLGSLLFWGCLHIAKLSFNCNFNFNLVGSWDSLILNFSSHPPPPVKVYWDVSLASTSPKMHLSYI